MPMSSALKWAVCPLLSSVQDLCELVITRGKSQQFPTSIEEEQRDFEHDLPSGKLTEVWKIIIFNGKTYSKWPVSMAILDYQRVFESSPSIQSYPKTKPQSGLILGGSRGEMTHPYISVPGS